MLSTAENEYLCRIGPDTPMGNLMRQYCLLPAIRSDELREPGGAPLQRRGRAAVRLSRPEVRRQRGVHRHAHEPAESDFRTKVKAVAYPTRERNGII